MRDMHFSRKSATKPFHATTCLAASLGPDMTIKVRLVIVFVYAQCNIQISAIIFTMVGNINNDMDQYNGSSATSAWNKTINF